jgi:hypothetical protein
MSLYGYSDALSQGAAFNARVKNYNDGVLAANQRAQDVHDKLVKDQKGKVSGDKMKEDEDGAIYGAMDAKSFLGAGAGFADCPNALKSGAFGVVGLTSIVPVVVTFPVSSIAIMRIIPYYNLLFLQTYQLTYRMVQI